MHPLNAELNPICHLLALLRGANIVVVSGLRVKRNTNSIFFFVDVSTRGVKFIHVQIRISRTVFSLGVT